jgi:hypothetical protein
VRLFDRILVSVRPSVRTRIFSHILPSRIVSASVIDGLLTFFEMPPFYLGEIEEHLLVAAGTNEERAHQESQVRDRQSEVIRLMVIVHVQNVALQMSKGGVVLVKFMAVKDSGSSQLPHRSNPTVKREPLQEPALALEVTEVARHW